MANGGSKHASALVVCVISAELSPSRRAEEQIWFIPKMVLKTLLKAFLSVHVRGTELTLRKICKRFAGGMFVLDARWWKEIQGGSANPGSAELRDKTRNA